jgi:hypothetical protein
VAWIAAPLEVVGRGGPTGVARLDVIALVPEPVATVHTSDAVKVRQRAELQGDLDLNGNVFGPPLEVAHVGPVVEEPGEERVVGDLLDD